MTLTLTINGEQHQLLANPSATLLQVVREQLGLTGSKEGCGTGACGACTMLVDGRPVYSCLLLVGALQDQQIRTIEGLITDGELDVLQTAFVEEGAIQCGFCIPGMIVAARAILDSDDDPSEEAIRDGLSGNYCRCTGYVKIIRAVTAAARRAREIRSQTGVGR